MCSNQTAGGHKHSQPGSEELPRLIMLLYQ
jgi:hypothetical protein